MLILFNKICNLNVKYSTDNLLDTYTILIYDAGSGKTNNLNQKDKK